jgi:hypothetical protein
MGLDGEGEKKFLGRMGNHLHGGFHFKLSLIFLAPKPSAFITSFTLHSQSPPSPYQGCFIEKFDVTEGN